MWIITTLLVITVLAGIILLIRGLLEHLLFNSVEGQIHSCWEEIVWTNMSDPHVDDTPMPDSVRYIPIITFKVNNERYTVSEKTAAPWKTINFRESVTVYYNPAKPEENRLSNTTLLIGCFLTFLGMVGLTGILIYVW